MNPIRDFADDLRKAFSTEPVSTPPALDPRPTPEPFQYPGGTSCAVCKRPLRRGGCVRCKLCGQPVCPKDECKQLHGALHRAAALKSQKENQQ